MGILCIPLTMVWWTYHNKYKQPLSAKTDNLYLCLRSAMLMVDNNGQHTADNGLDMIDMKKRCIQSTAHILRPVLENYLFSNGMGSGVFVDNVNNNSSRLVLTCYHVVRQSPLVWVRSCNSYQNNRSVLLTPPLEADLLYVEPHLDLALIRIQEIPSLLYTRSTPMPWTTDSGSGSSSTEFGQPVSMLGNGNTILFALHPDMPVITHNTVNVPGFSGSPLIDTDGRLCGLTWGGIIKRGIITCAVDYKTLKEFITRALTYETNGIKHNRLTERYELDIRSDSQLLGLILSTKPFSGSFIVRSVLPTVSDEAKSIIGARVLRVFGHELDSMDVLRLAIDTNPVIKLWIGLPTDDDSSGSSTSSGSRGTVRNDDSISTVNINTIAPVDYQGFRIKPLVI
ncbi:uncharacterized protein LOC128955022 [Oppia nitens]|uniref:uncharacterized protein LOC128955022 n=1 Tax=Oppia nitens TaxID=1686743 RepID=UPI0023DAFF7F|nr:uncharacterized protein LOC128955022 [Oppia nitens]